MTLPIKHVITEIKKADRLEIFLFEKRKNKNGKNANSIEKTVSIF
jgi:hypothetical protein